MLTNRIKVQLVAFVVIALAATSYLGARYAGIDPLSDDYQVRITLPSGGGAFDNGEVTYQGVAVGRIDSLRVAEGGAEAVVTIDADAPDIPADVQVQVANRSAIGEQYIDLREGTADGPVLRDGAVLRAGPASQPPAIDALLRSGRDFAASVPQDSLTTVIDETYDLAQGSGEDLDRLLQTSQRLSEIADENFLVTSALIENSDRVLTTQAEASDSIASFSADLNTIAGTLESSDGDLRRLISNSPAAAREVQALVDQVGRPLGVLMANLVTPAQVFGINSRGIEDALIRAPEAVSVGWAITGSRGINLGLAQNYFDPLPCTSGYGGTQLREGLDTGEGRPMNLNAGCTAAPSSGTNVRGPRSISGGGSAAPARATGSTDVAGRVLDPARGVVAADVEMASSLADLMGGAR